MKQTIWSKLHNNTILFNYKITSNANLNLNLSTVST